MIVNSALPLVMLNPRANFPECFVVLHLEDTSPRDTLLMLGKAFDLLISDLMKMNPDHVDSVLQATIPITEIG